MSGAPAARRRPSVSLLMPNRDNATVLDLVLERLSANTTYPDVELVVVDDGSTDGSREILRRWRDSGRFPGDVTVEERPHSGVIATLNHGLEIARGELVVQLDGDASIETPGWLEKLVSFHCSDPRIGFVCGRVVIDGKRTHAYGINLVGPAGMHDRGTTPTEPAGARSWHSRIRRPVDARADPAVRDRIAEVDACIGCCMMYRREVAREIGGYDPGFHPVWFDDVDLSLSGRRHGLKNFYFPGVYVNHRLSMRPKAPVHGVRDRVLRTGSQAIRSVLPDPVTDRIARVANLDVPLPAHQERLRGHYAYWRSKWGWDPLNPDMDRVLDRWAGSEVVWAYEPERRALGEEIAAKGAA